MGSITHNINGVRVRPLRIIEDDRGAVMHMLRADSPQFDGFGEVYISMIKAGSVKAWKRHLAMVQNLSVPFGAIRLVIYDDRADSPTCGRLQVITTGSGCGRYELIRLPPMVWYGFLGLANADSLIVNCASLPHEPNEVERLALDSASIPYSWAQE